MNTNIILMAPGCIYLGMSLRRFRDGDTAGGIRGTLVAVMFFAVALLIK